MLFKNLFLIRLKILLFCNYIKKINFRISLKSIYINKIKKKNNSKITLIFCNECYKYL